MSGKYTRRFAINRTVRRIFELVLLVALLLNLVLIPWAPPKSPIPYPYRNTEAVSDQFQAHEGFYCLPNRLMCLPSKVPVGNCPKMRILTIGGSGAVGSVCTTFQSFPIRLQKILWRKGLDAEVINAATEGSDSTAYRNTVEKDGILECLQPDVVLLYTGTNEYLRLRVYKNFHPGWSVGREKMRSWAEDMPLVRYLEAYFNLAIPLAEQTITAVQIKDTIVPEDRELVEQLYADNIAYIAQACRRKNIKLFILPYVRNVEHPPLYITPALNSIMQANAQKFGAEYIDLEKELSQSMGHPVDYDVLVDFGHFSPWGSRLMAQIVARHLRDASLLPAEGDHSLTPVMPMASDPLEIFPSPEEDMAANPYDIEEFACIVGNPTPARKVTFSEVYRQKLPALDSLRASDQGGVEGITQYGHLAFLVHEYEQALELYKEALRRAGGDVSGKGVPRVSGDEAAHLSCLHRNIAHTLSILSRFDEALDHYSCYVQLAPLSEPTYQRLVQQLKK